MRFVEYSCGLAGMVRDLQILYAQRRCALIKQKDLGVIALRCGTKLWLANWRGSLQRIKSLKSLFGFCKLIRGVCRVVTTDKGVSPSHSHLVA